ncbi:MAG: hypothetical protein LBT69_03260 [Lactobacillales bacterium]|jgi:hypothetical protein|nr:hypothetical protein [Lactobacillales bacterium]
MMKKMEKPEIHVDAKGTWCATHKNNKFVIGSGAVALGGWAAFAFCNVLGLSIAKLAVAPAI